MADPGRLGEVLPGLVTTTMVTVLMCATVFQRRSRHGFLDELETVRGEALTAPRGEVATAVAMADAAEAWDRLNGEGDEGPVWTGWPGDDDMDDDGDQAWTGPSPHPIRPSEMWHAGGGQGRLSAIGTGPDSSHDDPSVARASDSSTDASRSDGYEETQGTYPDPAHAAADGSRRRFARFRPVDQPGETTPSVDGPEVPLIPSTDGSGLLGGPVRRRTRSGRDRRPLPDARPLRAPSTEPEEHSPLVDAPLPPAAPPATAIIDLSAIIDLPAIRGAAAINDAPVMSDAEPTAARAAVVPPAPAEMLVTGLAQAVPEVRSELVVDDRSELAVGATVVRFGDGSRTSMAHGDDGPVVQVQQGSCWVTVLGDGPLVTVRAQLPQAEVVVAAGGRAFALVEPDGSAFAVVYAGTATLVGNGERISLQAGAMVLVSAAGAVQVDQATVEELAADPSVASNLELDATR